MESTPLTGKSVLRHRSFVGPTVYWNRLPLNTNREIVRAQAEAFVSEIGVDNVVSVAEHAMSFGPFSVVVWYRAGARRLTSALQRTRPAITFSGSIKVTLGGPVR